MKTISAVIPVFSKESLHFLLECIARNTLLPTRLILIDNTGKGDLIVPMPMPGVTVDIIEPRNPMKTNASWRKGFALAREANLIAILRDDILLGYDFFQKARQASNYWPMASVYCPAVEPNAKKLNRFMYERAECEKMKAPEDLAFVLRSEYLRDLPAIPDALGTYFGAEWIHLWTARIWMRPWIRINNTLVFSHKPVNIASPDDKAPYEAERKIFETLIHDL